MYPLDVTSIYSTLHHRIARSKSCSNFAKSLLYALTRLNLSSSALCYTVLALLLWLPEPARVSVSLHRPCHPLLRYCRTIGQHPLCIHAGALDTARGLALSRRQRIITTQDTGSMIAVSTRICLPDHLSHAHQSLRAPVRSMQVASGSRVPVQPPIHARRRRKTTARSHTPTHVKHPRLDPEHSPMGARSGDAHSNDDISKNAKMLSRLSCA